jgi:inhibitor of KinA sporulation pathway (predicted exonuclease)
MAKSIDQILVVDVESTCWDGPTPKGQSSDIIEIGLCVLDVKSLERLEKRSILVCPQRSEISPFCTELTTLKEADFSSAASLAEACSVLRRDYRSRDRLWASYGDYDRRQIERNCKELGVSYPFGPSHLNVKSMLAITLSQSREPGMARGLNMLGLKLEGTHHRGHDDAWNIALILATLLAKGRELSRD